MSTRDGTTPKETSLRGVWGRTPAERERGGGGGRAGIRYSQGCDSCRYSFFYFDRFTGHEYFPSDSM